jgi:mannosylglucosylglycerate synthase
VEAAKWGWALGQLGYEVRTVAGAGEADVILPGLGLSFDGAPPHPPSVSELTAAVGGVDLVVVENLLSLPLNVGATSVLAKVLRGRPAVLHHHDLPWQRSGFGDAVVRHDPAWRHVTINRLSQIGLAKRGIDATVIPNAFDVKAPVGDGDGTRRLLGLEGRVVLQPTRAIRRKNVPAALTLAEELGATYWLLGPAEEGYGDELHELLAGARVPVLHRPGEIEPADAYAAADVVAFPSVWEGFGNPVVESAVHRKPLFIGDGYPVASELEEFGFRWFRSADEVAAFLDHPDPDLLVHNHEVARRHFNLADLPARIAEVLP